MNVTCLHCTVRTYVAMVTCKGACLNLVKGCFVVMRGASAVKVTILKGMQLDLAWHSVHVKNYLALAGYS
jgi:hypothetical protein